MPIRKNTAPKSSPTPSVDLVNHPPHYTKGGIECIDALRAAMTEEQFMGYLRGCAIKYLWRYENKGGLQDLQKSNWYLARLTELVIERSNAICEEVDKLLK
jgi:hypothetical protein